MELLYRIHALGLHESHPNFYRASKNKLFIAQSKDEPLEQEEPKLCDPPGPLCPHSSTNILNTQDLKVEIRLIEEGDPRPAGPIYSMEDFLLGCRKCRGLAKDSYLREQDVLDALEMSLYKRE